MATHGWPGTSRSSTERVTTVEKLATDAYDDFSAILHGSGRPARSAWVAYSDGANEILTRAYEGGSWGSAKTVTEAAGDIRMVKTGRAGDGSVWCV